MIVSLRNLVTGIFILFGLENCSQTLILMLIRVVGYASQLVSALIQI